MKHTWTILLAAGLMLGGLGCNREPETKEILRSRSEDVNVSVRSATGDFTEAAEEFYVEFRAPKDNALIKPGDVTVSAAMTMPGMAPMLAPLVTEPTATVGRYKVKGVFPMNGSWKFQVEWKTGDKTSNLTFIRNVR